MSSPNNQVENTRKLTIKSKKSKANKKTSTDYQNDSFTSKKLKQRNSVTENEEKEKSRLTELKEKTSQLESELQSLKSNYDIEKNNTVSTIKVYNESMRKKDKELKNISNINKDLIQKLKTIEHSLDARYKKALNCQKKKITDVNLSKESKDIVITNLRKLMDITEKEKNKSQQLKEQVDKGLEKKHTDNLKNLENKISELKNEINGLNSIKLKHNNCDKDIRNLYIKLKFLKNTVELEKKRNVKNRNQDNEILKENMPMSTKTKSQEEIKIRNRPKYYLYGIKAKPSLQKINQNSNRFILNEFDYIQKMNNITSRKQRSFVNKDINSIQLFKSEETSIINKVIPENYRIKLLQKFEQVNKEKDYLGKKFRDFYKMKKTNLQLSEDIIDMKTKFSKIKTEKINLVKENANINKKINILKGEILSVKQKLDKYDKILYIKNKENNILKLKEKEFEKIKK